MAKALSRAEMVTGIFGEMSWDTGQSHTFYRLEGVVDWSAMGTFGDLYSPTPYGLEGVVV